MKKILILFSLFTMQISVASSQNLIAVQNGGPPDFYPQLTTAFANAQDGDTIYIPGFAYTINSLTINKKLHVIGCGHNPDSSSATGITQLNGLIYLIDGADGSTFNGVYITGSIISGNSTLNEDVDNISISRCKLSYIGVSTVSTNWIITQNVVLEIDGITNSNGTGAENCYITNNIISYGVYYFGSNTFFGNNIFLNNYSLGIAVDQVVGCLFENNIFMMPSYPFNIVTSCTFNKNLFVSNFTIPNGSTGLNNIINQPSSSIFVNQSGDTYGYNQDYHLLGSSPGNNAGTDGTDMGVYGGGFPWKEGSIPFNPHIKSKTISTKTNASGNINVNITVEAQED